MATAGITLELTTANGGDLNDFVRIELNSIQQSQHYQNNLQVVRTVTIRDIEVNAAAIYRIQVTPNNYRTVQRFQMLTAGQTVQSGPLPVRFNRPESSASTPQALKHSAGRSSPY